MVQPFIAIPVSRGLLGRLITQPCSMLSPSLVQSRTRVTITSCSLRRRSWSLAAWWLTGEVADCAAVKIFLRDHQALSSLTHLQSWCKFYGCSDKISRRKNNSSPRKWLMETIIEAFTNISLHLKTVALLLFHKTSSIASYLMQQPCNKSFPQEGCNAWFLSKLFSEGGWFNFMAVLEAVIIRWDKRGGQMIRFSSLYYTIQFNSTTNSSLHSDDRVN